MAKFEHIPYFALRKAIFIGQSSRIIATQKRIDEIIQQKEVAPEDLELFKKNKEMANLCTNTLVNAIFLTTRKN